MTMPKLDAQTQAMLDAVLQYARAIRPHVGDVVVDMRTDGRCMVTAWRYVESSRNERRETFRFDQDEDGNWYDATNGGQNG